jgi:hypothetical protein
MCSLQFGKLFELRGARMACQRHDAKGRKSTLVETCGSGRIDGFMIPTPDVHLSAGVCVISSSGRRISVWRVSSGQIFRRCYYHQANGGFRMPIESAHANQLRFECFRDSVYTLRDWGLPRRAGPKAHPVSEAAVDPFPGN